ncbi:hypothetical protein EJB05_52541 [Eragrostis curvula]|uniref:Uncharacterized protein n=1 Tax=Eragrostis curvula TaxID=38414 RepID=A0A5J9SSP4_9POAL|nr:hypothetical protein EJB05_52541 [Eragrostis curvula]
MAIGVGNPKKQVRHKPTSYLKSRMIGCLVNSWTDLMKSWSRRWIKAKDMLDSSARVAEEEYRNQGRRCWKRGSMEKIKFQLKEKPPYDTVPVTV